MKRCEPPSPTAPASTGSRALRPGTYSVTFTLQGFSTVKREGIELTGSFIATVNTDLRVGTLQETIVVTGETPIVDVQSARRETVVGKDLIADLPTTGGYSSLLALVPGIVGGTRDVQTGPCACTFSSHGAMLAGRANEEGRTLLDGLLISVPQGELLELCGRHAERAGSVVYRVRQPGRDGNGRAGAEHRAAYRRQQRIRQLLRRGRSAVAPGQQLHAGAEERRADGGQPADQELRLQRSGRRPVQEGPPLVLSDRQNARQLAVPLESITTGTPATRTPGPTIPTSAGRPSAIARGRTATSG